MMYGAKGGSSTFKQTPDNLRSNDTFEGVLGMAIGPLKGPTKGLKSIKIDGTALENATGELNFGDFVATIGDGDPLKFPQKVQLKLGAGSAPQQVGLSLTNTNPSGTPGAWVTRTLNNTNADFIDLRFIANQLFRQDSKGIYNETASIHIQMKPVGKTNWITPTLGTSTGSYNQNGVPITTNGSSVNLYVPRSYYDTNGSWPTGSAYYQITGKTSQAAVYELRINVPNEGAYANVAWDIRCRLIEPESVEADPNITKRSLTWESMAAVYGPVMGDHEDWRGVAWMQLYGKASDQLTGVPEITGEWDTKIVSVPPSSIFNPATQAYTAGVWDGSWTKAFTSDPAWIINDAISDSLSGLSLIAAGSYLNKWDALEASKWFGAQVPDGNGGTHPRYSLNLSVTQPQKAEEFIRYLGGAVGALVWDQGDGQWRMRVDKPDTPVDIFTLDNIEGEFTYSGTDVDTRFNDIIGKFQNAEMDYREDAVRLYDNTSIAQIGRKPTTIALIGCTNRQEAMRRVKLRIRTTVNENKIVTFTTNRRGRNIEPLDMILISDGDLGDSAQKVTGRGTVRANNLLFDFRDPIYLPSGPTYNVVYSFQNTAYNPEPTAQPTGEWRKPTIIHRRVVNPATTGNFNAPVTVLRVTSGMAALPANFSFAIEAVGLPVFPRTFRVTSVVPADDGERVTITAINVDVDKWAAADAVTKEDSVFQDLRGIVPQPVLVPGKPLLSIEKVPIEQGSQTNLQARWQRPSGAFISGFRVRYSINGGALQTAVERQQVSEWEFPNAGPGVYRVEVSTIDRRGSYSIPLVDTLVVDQALIDATEIEYTDGQTIEDLQPLTPDADNTAGAIEDAWLDFTGKPALEVVTDLSNALDGLSAEQIRGAAWRGESDSILYMPDGRPVIAEVEAIGTNVDGVQQFVAFLKEVDASAGTSKFLFSAKADGTIVGMEGLAGPEFSQLSFAADKFLFVDPNGGNPINALTYEGGVWKMKSIEVDKITYGSLIPKFGGQYSQLDPNGGFEIMPSGIIRQWGKYRASIGTEVQVSVVFPMQFPTAVTSIIATPWITTFSNTRDLWLQNVGNPSLSGASFATQSSTNNNQSIDGFDWHAYGY